jgi:hypothetical protein
MLTRRVLILAIATLALAVGSVDVPLVETLRAQREYCKADRDCDDGNPCTADKCTSKSACANLPDDSVSRSCYSDAGGSPGAGTPGVGNCRVGTQRCSGGQFGPCAGAVFAAAETCGDGDEDCDGQTDEEDASGCTNYFRLKHGEDCNEAGCSKCLCKPEAPYLVRKRAPDGASSQSSPLDWLYRR